MYILCSVIFKETKRPVFIPISLNSERDTYNMYTMKLCLILCSVIFKETKRPVFIPISLNSAHDTYNMYTIRSSQWKCSAN